MAKWKEGMQPDLFDHGKTACANCNKKVYLSEAVVKSFCTHNESLQEQFCTDHCHQEWHIKRLNERGL